MAESDPKENNVIVFPGTTRNRPPQSLEEIVSRVELAKTTRIEEVTEIVIVNMFEDLFENAFDFTDRHDTNKDMAFLIEALKSMMAKHDGLDHPFHGLAEQYFSADAKGDLTFIETGGVIPIDIIDGDGEMGC